MSTECARKQTHQPAEGEARQPQSSCPIKKKKYRRRLFIGEGDFGYTEGLLNKHLDKHKDLAKYIVACELYDTPVWGAESDIIDERIKRINSLKERGVTVHFGIDGRELHRNPKLKGERFQRIQWNCPYLLPGTSENEFQQVIVDFFYSCEKIQLKGDRIHITLIQGLEDEDWRDRRQYEHNLVKGSMQFGYKLIRKRRFGKDRYPGYQHRKGENLEKLNVPGVHREFVFEKDPTFSVIVNSVPLKMSNDKKTYRIDINKKNGAKTFRPDLGDCYFVCSTDDDSSDYCSSDE
ncbi:uncharacterized protein LOC135847023 [Planococcus citri]|uniref:uncharacterized protein LOC135847023 n=1 Tax=Planococcus citri TaxID=170843 RepID=UPI0031F81F7E